MFGCFVTSSFEDSQSDDFILLVDTQITQKQHEIFDTPTHSVLFFLAKSSIEVFFQQFWDLVAHS